MFAIGVKSQFITLAYQFPPYERTKNTIPSIVGDCSGEICALNRIALAEKDGLVFDSAIEPELDVVAVMST